MSWDSNVERAPYQCLSDQFPTDLQQFTGAVDELGWFCVHTHRVSHVEAEQRLGLLHLAAQQLKLETRVLVVGDYAWPREVVGGDRHDQG